MDLLLNDEQIMLRDSAATFTERRGGAHRLRDLRDKATKVDAYIWQQAAKAGWLSIMVPESAGGLGLGLTELCLVSEELGKGLVPEPIAAVAAVASAAGNCAKNIINGKRLVLPALIETTRGIGDEPPTVTVLPNCADVSLDGVKTSVIAPQDAAAFLVSATVPDGIGLALVDAANVEITAAETIDGTASGSIALHGSKATLVADANEAPTRISALLDALHLSNAAELLGVMETAQDITVEYLKTREQFDRPIGSFQTLQHRAVDNLAAIEICRSLIYRAASAVDSGGRIPGLASAALSLSTKSALEVCKSTIQMHGGIGFTDEHDIGLYLKRTMTLAARFGNAGLHRKRYAEYAQPHD